MNFRNKRNRGRSRVRNRVKEVRSRARNSSRFMVRRNKYQEFTFRI